MKNKMIKMSTRVMAAVLVAASVLSTATPVYAAENTTIVEGQGDVIDDQFAYVEGQGDVIDDEFAYVEGQGDIIDDEFAVDAEVEGQGDVIDDQFAFVDGQGDVIDDQFAYVEGQGDVIDDQFAYVEGQGDIIDDQFAVASDECEYVTDEQFVVDSSCMKNVSFAAVGSANEAQKAEEAKKDDDDLVFTFNPFYSIVPFRAVPSGNQSENKSDALETVQTINKFINPSDSVYGNPIRELIDDSDVLGEDEKEYLKNSTSLMIGADEGMACTDFLPLWGSVKKVGKMSESLVKLHDSKTTGDQINNTIDVVQNLAEGVVCAIPGGGLALNAYKAQMEFGSYCFKKVCRFVNWLF